VVAAVVQGPSDGVVELVGVRAADRPVRVADAQDQLPVLPRPLELDRGRRAAHRDRTELGLPVVRVVPGVAVGDRSQDAVTYAAEGVRDSLVHLEHAVRPDLHVDDEIGDVAGADVGRMGRGRRPQDRDERHRPGRRGTPSPHAAHGRPRPAPRQARLVTVSTTSHLAEDRWSRAGYPHASPSLGVGSVPVRHSGWSRGRRWPLRDRSGQRARPLVRVRVAGTGLPCSRPRHCPCQ
jgi:hypothetical protein